MSLLAKKNMVHKHPNGLLTDMYVLKVKKKKHYYKIKNLFKVDNEESRTTSFRCRYY